MVKEKVYHKNSSESGAALIFALSLLALLLVMLIGFLASNILEQRIAYTYGDATASRLLARGALLQIKDQLANSADDLAWMRNRPADDLLLAPVISLADDGSLDSHPQNSDAAEADGEGGDAYQELKPLLRRYFGGKKSNYIIL